MSEGAAGAEFGDYMNTDMVIACVDLVERSGAMQVEIGYLHEGVPSEQAGWYAHCSFQGARITSADHASPSAAALGLSERLLRGATCRCGRRVILADGRPGCRWTLAGKRWEPGCDAPPIRVEGKRGDHAAMERALAERVGNRAERRGKRR